MTIRYRLRGVSGAPEVDMTIQVPSEPAEYFAGLNLDGLECSVAAQSLFIRLIPDGPAVRSCSRKPGRSRTAVRMFTARPAAYGEFILQGGTEKALATPDYLNAARQLGEEDKVALTQAPSLEVALVAVPGLYEELTVSTDQEEVLVASSPRLSNYTIGWWSLMSRPTRKMPTMPSKKPAKCWSGSTDCASCWLMGS